MCRLYGSKLPSVRPGIVLPRTAVGVRLLESLGIGCCISYIKCGCQPETTGRFRRFRARARPLRSEAPLRAVEQFVDRQSRWPPPSRAGLCVAACPSDRPSMRFRAWDAPRGRRDRSAPIKTDLPPIAVDFRDVAEAAGLTGRHVSGDRRPEEVHPRSYRQRGGHFRRGRRRLDGRVSRKRHDARRRRCRRAVARAGSIATSAVCGSRT